MYDAIVVSFGRCSRCTPTRDANGGSGFQECVIWDLWNVVLISRARRLLFGLAAVEVETWVGMMRGAACKSFAGKASQGPPPALRCKPEVVGRSSGASGCSSSLCLQGACAGFVSEHSRYS